MVFQKHIGIVSDNRNSKKFPFVIHPAHPYQICYEEDILGILLDVIVWYWYYKSVFYLSISFVICSFYRIMKLFKEYL